MGFDWDIFMRILLAILRILAQLPPEVDNTPILKELGDAIEANGVGPPKK